MYDRNDPPLNLGIDEWKVRRRYPNLRVGRFDWTSEPDERYNCAAFALGLYTDNWWPTDYEGYAWPDGTHRDESLKSFGEGFALFGYEQCESGELEVGYEKLAIYAVDDPDETEAAIKHVARQLPDGRWASKLGQAKDSEHPRLDDLAGPWYGVPRWYFRRRRDRAKGNR
jgi:hypothetical protein